MFYALVHEPQSTMGVKAGYLDLGRRKKVEGRRVLQIRGEFTRSQVVLPDCKMID